MNQYQLKLINKVGAFCIFDPREEHAAEEIFTDKKRFTIDFTVFRDQQSVHAYFDGQAKGE